MRPSELSSAEYRYYKSCCPFSTREIAVLGMWRRGASIVETSLALHLSTATISRARKAIQKKIAREEPLM